MYRDKVAETELHLEGIDNVVVLDGEATLVYGGDMKEARMISEAEFRGTSLTGDTKSIEIKQGRHRPDPGGHGRNGSSRMPAAISAMSCSGSGRKTRALTVGTWVVRPLAQARGVRRLKRSPDRFVRYAVASHPEQVERQAAHHQKSRQRSSSLPAARPETAPTRPCRTPAPAATAAKRSRRDGAPGARPRRHSRTWCCPRSATGSRPRSPAWHARPAAMAGQPSRHSDRR